MAMTADASEVEQCDPYRTFQAKRPAAGSHSRIEPTECAAPVALVEGRQPSLVTKTNALRRTRLKAAAAVLSVIYGVLLAWFAIAGSRHVPSFWTFMTGRFVLSASVACLLASRLPMSAAAVRRVECFLFGGLTLGLGLSGFYVNRSLLEHGETPEVLEFVKNLVIQSFALMVLYGTFIPNHPRVAAKVVISMALMPLVALCFFFLRGGLSDPVIRLFNAEHIGTNVLFLIFGAGTATYGAYLLNNLRTELHEASKFGQYHLLKKLGEGGMGVVFLAEHQLLKRPCVLKMIKGDNQADPIARARFEREVRSSAKLEHPNIIGIYDYGHTEEGTFYYVMEYLKGLSLADLVGGGRPLPAGRVIYLFRQICAGLAEAHAIGLVHRDLKPGNIFVARRGGESDIAKVLDFGLVKLTRASEDADLTSDDVVSGTPNFMPPEQAMMDKSLDARADIYALGSLLYYALTGRPPFVGPNVIAVIVAHTRDAVIPPSRFNPTIPGDLEDIVIRCLAKRPEDRYPDVKVLSRALGECESSSDWDAEVADQWWSARSESGLISAAH